MGELEIDTPHGPARAHLDEDLGAALRSSARILYGRGATRFRGLREGAGPLARVGAKLLRNR